MFNSIKLKKITVTSFFAVLMAGTLNPKPVVSTVTESPSDTIELTFLAGEFQCASNVPLSEFVMNITTAENSTPLTLRVGETALVKANNLQDLNIDIKAISGNCIPWSSLADPVFMSKNDEFPSYIDPAKAIYEQTSLNEFQEDLSNSQGFMLMELGGPKSKTTTRNTESAYDWNDIVLFYDLDPVTISAYPAD